MKKLVSLLLAVVMLASAGFAFAEEKEAPVVAATELAYKGEGELNARSWCRFCKLRTTCRKRA